MIDGMCEVCKENPAILKTAIRRGGSKKFKISLPERDGESCGINLCEQCAAKQLMDFTRDHGLADKKLVIQPDKQLSEEDRQTLKNIGLEVTE